MVTFHEQTRTLIMYLHVRVMTGSATRLVQKGDFLHFKTQPLVRRKGGSGVNALNKFHYISHPISKTSTFPLGSSGT